MNTLTINKIAQIVNGKLILPNNYILNTEEASSFVIDSRVVQKGSVFIASKGNNVDSHIYVNEVFDKGTLACIVEEENLEAKGPLILVENSFKALRDLATYYRGILHCKVIGITGSVGKTSAKECIAAVLATKYKVHKTKANLNNEIGLPLTVLDAPSDTEVLVLEMGVDRFGDMEIIASIAKPDICVFTNIGDCHLEYLKSRDGIFKEKTKMFNYMNLNGEVVLNGDDERLKKITTVNNKKPLFYGKNDNNDFKLVSFNSKGYGGSIIKVITKDEEFKVEVAIPGEHTIYNVLAAIVVGSIFNLDNSQISKGLSSLVPTRGRGKLIKHNSMNIVDDTYNASPTSMIGALNLLNKSNTRKVAIIGDMFELGEDEIKMHKEIGQICIDNKIDLVITCGNLMKNAYDITKEFIDSYWYSSIEEMFNELDNLLKPNDTILIKASHGMKFDKIVDYLLEK